VRPPRVLERPVWLEAATEKIRALSRGDRVKKKSYRSGQMETAHQSFCEFYRLGQEAHPSRLAKVF
jgi:hypothetical protein